MQIRLLTAAFALTLLAACSGPTATRAPMESSSRADAPAEVRSHRASLTHRTTRAVRTVRAGRHEPSARREASAPSEGGSVGVASYYGATGLTAAHRSLPMGTRVRVTNTANGRSVVVRINDRGPFIRGRSIDLSHSAAQAVGMTQAGVAKVRMEVLQ
ncbi:MAG: septal ring lytic transglycosylase RlpA family protein [Hyphomicrobiales bacterium]|nr:septal ring lytic transglycosylase RlpA family protein [Hyphomicrobiales bacterium]MBV8826323.1 septal ring lytic transglycosylase RlpA family protein [Hyphomicrobiales bacterium]